MLLSPGSGFFTRITKVSLISKLAIILMILVQHCDTDSASVSVEDDKYSEEDNQIIPQGLIYRLSAHSDEVPDPHKIISSGNIPASHAPEVSNNSIHEEAAIFNAQNATSERRMDSTETEAFVGSIEVDDTHNSVPLSFPLFLNHTVWPSLGKSDQTSILEEDEDNVNDYQFPSLDTFSRQDGHPAALDRESFSPEMLKVMKKANRPKVKRIRATLKPSIIPPASSVTAASREPNAKNNVSLKAYFSSPETEESSSVELELSVSPGKDSDDQHQTKIEISNPNSDRCLTSIHGRDSLTRRRVLMNVWSYSGPQNRLKLQSQKEVPPWVLDGAKVRDGEILNRDEIPESVLRLVAPALLLMGKSDNTTLELVNSGTSPRDKFFSRRKDLGRMMIHYVLWGDKEKKWRTMLDRTVETYMRNYLMSTFGKGRGVRLEKGNPNWRKMRNVLLSFMNSPDQNCSSTSQKDTNQPQRERDSAYLIVRPGPGPKPAKGKPNGIGPQQSTNLQQDGSPITRDGYGGFGWQTNGFGGQQPQQQQQGWGQQQPQQGWGWETQNQGWGGWGGDESKKSKKKKKKKQKKAKKKAKKAKKKAKKKGKKGKGGGGGWGGWRPPQQQGWGQQQPQQQQQQQQQHSPGWQGAVTFDSDLIQQALSVWGLISLKVIPVLLLAAAVYIIHLLSKASSPQVIYSGSSGSSGGGRGWGWKRRTTKPMEYYMASSSTLNPDPWGDRYYYNHNATTIPYATTVPYATTTRVPTTPYLKPTIQGLMKKSYPNVSYSAAQSKKDIGKSYSQQGYHNYSYDDYYDYETEYYNAHRHVPRPKTKQEEELLKILSKHKKESVERLLQNWKLSKLKGKNWA